MTDGLTANFSLDGRIFLGREIELSPWQVDPAIEYRTLAFPGPSLNFAGPSIHPDGRILAVGTDRGVVLWDLARVQSSRSCRSGWRGIACSNRRVTCSPTARPVS